MIYGGKRMSELQDSKKYFNITEEKIKNSKIAIYIIEEEGKQKMLFGLNQEGDTEIFALATIDQDFKDMKPREIADVFRKTLADFLETEKEQEREAEGNPPKIEVTPYPTLDQISGNVKENIENLHEKCGSNLKLTEQFKLLLTKGLDADIIMTNRYDKETGQYSTVYGKHTKEVIEAEISGENFQKYWTYLRVLSTNNKDQYKKIKNGNIRFNSIMKLEMLCAQLPTQKDSKGKDIIKIKDQDTAELVERYLNLTPDYEVDTILEHLGTTGKKELQRKAADYKSIKKGDRDYIDKMETVINSARTWGKLMREKHQKDINCYLELVEKFGIISQIDAFKRNWNMEMEGILTQENKDYRILQAGDGKAQEEFKKSDDYKKALEEARRKGEPGVPDQYDLGREDEGK